MGFRCRSHDTMRCHYIRTIISRSENHLSVLKYYEKSISPLGYDTGYTHVFLCIWMPLCVCVGGIDSECIICVNFALNLAEHIDFSEYLSRNQLPAKKENDSMLPTSGTRDRRREVHRSWLQPYESTVNPLWSLQIFIPLWTCWSFRTEGTDPESLETPI